MEVVEGSNPQVRRNMRRFYVENMPSGKDLSLVGGEARHMTSVLRLREGDEVVIFDGTGIECVAVIRQASGASARLEITSRFQVSRELPLEVALGQGILKGKKMDFLIEKCAELGLRRFVPVALERAVPKLSGKEEDKESKWQRIAKEASKQCGRNLIMEVAQPCSLEDFLKTLSAYELAIIADPDEKRTLKEVLRDRSKPSSVVMAIGPEGGFSREELLNAVGSGMIPVRLGPAILRAETAALAMLAMVAYEYAL